MPSPDSSFLVITTIQPPTPAVREVVTTLLEEWTVLVVGDRKTPADWNLEGAMYLGLDDQDEVAPLLSPLLELDHYSRKNIGYLQAMASGAGCIAETDDDNFPKETFLSNVEPELTGAVVLEQGWVNVYRLFSEEKIWPRGFPLELLRESFEAKYSLTPGSRTCLIQQFLADGDPDVDAIFRLLYPEGTQFSGENVILPPGTYCPFNSQATVWWQEAFPLMYLPTHVSFRMTDIWRSLIAQRCLHEAGHSIGFCPSSVDQVRNEHSLLRDFEDEIPGYLGNLRIVDLLVGLELPGEGTEFGRNMRECYALLVDEGFVPIEELTLVDGWLESLDQLG